jgi:hypothetical protein
MIQQEVTQGSRKVIITANSQEGPFSLRLWVNNGETATLVSGKTKTLAGAIRSANRMLLRLQTNHS